MPLHTSRRSSLRALALSTLSVAALAASLPALADVAPPKFPLRDFFRNPTRLISA